jgi:transcriptional regulator with XRE-family HTH domain
MDVKAARQALGLTQTELAEKLGVTQATVSRFETGDLKVDDRTRLALEALRLKAAA